MKAGLLPICGSQRLSLRECTAPSSPITRGSSSACLKKWLAALAVTTAFTAAALAQAVRPGFNGASLPANDDDSTGQVPIGFSLNFFGVSYDKLFVNNNGNVTFDAAQSTFTPFPITTQGVRIIAPFFADVDTSGMDSQVVTYGVEMLAGRPAFGVNWVDVGYFRAHADKLNSFQLVLVDRSDVSAGDFDIELNYDKIQWETGDASEGSGGLGGNSARAGYANGAGATIELPGSAEDGALLDSNNSTGLIHSSLNSDVPGRYLFRVRNGVVIDNSPVANAGPDILANFGAVVALDGRGSFDPEGSPITFLWTQVSGPAVALTGETTAQPSFTMPGSAASLIFQVTVSDGALTASDTVEVTLLNAPPFPVDDTVFSYGSAITFDPRLNDINQQGGGLTIVGVTQGGSARVIFTGTSVTYRTSARFPGQDAFTYTVRAASGAIATATVRVLAPAGVTALVGDPVGPGPANRILGGIGAPQPGVFAGIVRESGAQKAALLASTGGVVLTVGDEAPGLGSTEIGAFGEPSGTAALATLKRASGVTAANDGILLTGLGTDAVRVAAREGAPLANLEGVTIKSFGAVDGNGTAVFFLATLQGAGVTAKNNLALCVALADGSVRVLLRAQQSAFNKQVTRFITLIGAPESLAEGHWRAGNDSLGVCLVLSDKTQRLVTIPANAGSEADWRQWASTDSPLDLPVAGATVSAFGVPAFGLQGVSFLGKLRPLPNSIGPDNDSAIFALTATVHLLARESGPVPDRLGQTIAGLAFKSFSEPVAGQHGRTAFIGLLKGSNAGASNNRGIWFSPDGSALRLLARTGQAAPGGGVWARFEALVLPDSATAGPLFLARLASQPGSGTAPSTARGLWGSGEDGEVKLLLREGMSVSSNGVVKVIKTFSALAPSTRTGGIASGYDGAGRVAVSASFTDGTQGLLRVILP